jgi:hypothetical protein
MTQVHEPTVARKQSRIRVSNKALAPSMNLSNAETAAAANTKRLPSLVSAEAQARPTVGTLQKSIAATKTSVHKDAVLFVSGTFSKPKSSLEFPSKNDLEELEWRLGL